RPGRRPRAGARRHGRDRLQRPHGHRDPGPAAGPRRRRARRDVGRRLRRRPDGRHVLTGPDHGPRAARPPGRARRRPPARPAPRQRTGERAAPRRARRPRVLRARSGRRGHLTPHPARPPWAKTPEREEGTMRTSKKAAALVGVAALTLLTACTPPAPPGGEGGAAAVTDPADVPETPSEPVTLNILDVAGNQRLTEGMVEEFVENNPDVIESVTWETGGAPDVTGIVKPQVDSGNLSIDVVFTGNDGLSAGIAQDLWLPVVDDYGDRLTNQENYLEPAANMQELAQGYGVVTTYYPSGPLLQYDPEVVGTPPATPDELLEWAEANPGKFGYARPANSGPGRTVLMGLPYLLGDEDPTIGRAAWRQRLEMPR